MACALPGPRRRIDCFNHQPNKRASPTRAAGRAEAGKVDEVDVAIFGAGPAGLSTALALHKACPELKVHVYERARKFRPSGGSLGLSTPNIFQAFRAIGPEVEAAVKEAGIARRNFSIADMHGENRTENFYESTIIAWFELQRALLSCLPTQHMVSLGSELSEIQENSDGVIVSLSDGRSVRAKLVLGADGNRSNARNFVQGDTQPEYCGAAVWRFFLPGENPFVAVSDTLVLTGDCKTFVMQPVRREGRVMTYVSGISGFPKDRLQDLNQTRYVQETREDSQRHTAKLERFAEALQSFNPEMMKYVLDNAVPESVLEHPMYSLDPSKDWVRGRVALLGDAAHVMPPNLSQGCPMAIEDAVQLASSILHHNGISDPALAHYEKIRKDRVTPIWKGSTEQAVGYYKNENNSDNPFRADNSLLKLFPYIQDYAVPPLSSTDMAS